MAAYPEHDKLKAVKERSQACGEFFEWLMARYHLATYHAHSEGCYKRHPDDGEVLGTACGMGTRTLYSANAKVDDLLAQYFGIDRKKLDAEKDAMLEEVRAANRRKR